MITMSKKAVKKRGLDGEALERWLNGMSYSAKYKDKKKHNEKYACRGRMSY